MQETSACKKRGQIMHRVTFFSRLVTALIIVFGQHYNSYSQDYFNSTIQYTYRLPANTVLSNVPWRDSIYRFPSFQPGRITLATGYSPAEEIRLNYNLYFAQMDFINSDGDTLQVKQIKELKVVTVGDHVFLHDYKTGYIEIIKQLPVALGVLHFMVTTHAEYASGLKVGVDDLRGTTSAQDRFYRKDRIFYFITADNTPLKATSSSLLKAFPSHKKTLKAYLKDNAIDFNKEEDLVRLIEFSNKL
jgi:hypothetical protein